MKAIFPIAGAWLFGERDTVFHILNVYTRAAQFEGLPAESAFRLQRMGGSILEMVN